jgi:hypothetical protein
VFDFGNEQARSLLRPKATLLSFLFHRFSIVRAFLIEEQRIVSMVMKSKKTTGATDAAAQPQAAGQKSK